MNLASVRHVARPGGLLLFNNSKSENLSPKKNPSSRTLRVHYGAGLKSSFPPAEPREFRSDIFKQTPPEMKMTKIVKALGVSIEDLLK